QHVIPAGVVGVDGARDRPFVLRQLGELAGEPAPHRLDGRARHHLARHLPAAHDVAEPREQAHGYAPAIRSAPARAPAPRGSAVAPSTQTSPPSKNSRFQIGAICLTRSMAYRFAAYASARCGERVTIATLASPI